MTDLDDTLRSLGYDRRWLEFGFITPADVLSLRDQLDELQAHGAEHHRYATFRRVLAQRTALSDDDLNRFLELAARDPDKALAASVFAMLLEWRGLTDRQFDFLASHPAYGAAWLQRLVRRRHLLTALATGPVDDAMVNAILDADDARLQRALLDLEGLSARHLRVIADRGRNKAIRNLARSRLSS